MGNSFVFEALRREDTPRLHEIYQVYRTSFPHPDEQEPFEAFRQILDLNEDEEVQQKFGPYRELVLAITRDGSREIVGGLVIGITTSPDHLNAGFASSVQAIYFFLDKPYRRHLTPATVKTEIRKWALETFPPPEGTIDSEVAVFFEANNPKNMTIDAIEQDYDNADLDPYRRYSAWLFFSRPLQFNYIQPALSSSKSPVRFLDLFYMGKGDGVPAPMLLRHLYSFVSVSVLKGHDANRDAEFSTMAEELRALPVVPFIPRTDPDLIAIQAEAKWRARAAGSARRQVRAMNPPRMPAGAAARLLLPPRLGNAIYRVAYRLYHQLERYHIGVSYLEFILGTVGILVVLVAWFAQLIERLGQEMFETGRRDVEMVVVGFLSLYIASRGVVHTRRSRLGHRFGSLRRQMRRRDSGRAADDESASDWFRSQLRRKMEHQSAFGPMIRADLPSDERSRVQRRVASYSAQIYSDRVWGVVDRVWQRWEVGELANWLQEFPEGLMGATFDTCPGHTFFSLVLPVKLPLGRMARINLRHLEIDERLARALSKQPGAVVRRNVDSQEPPPCLIVLRFLMSTREPGARRAAKLERQIALILTALLHVALMLERLAREGDIANGLPANTVILVVAVNPQSVRLLQWFGFRLLQRSAPHEGPETEDEPGEANMSVFRTAIGPPHERSPETQRFLELLADLLRGFNRVVAQRRRQSEDSAQKA
jgi:hypothetical protein